MQVQIICSQEEFEKTIKPLIQKTDTEVVVLYETAGKKSALEIRLKMIERNLKFDITKENLFRILRRRGYSFGRKTLTRDLALLEEEKKIKLEKRLGGSEGSTTYIREA